MIKNLVGGIAVGIANIIPGVSGGTMLVVLGLFDRVMESISNIFKVNSPTRYKDIMFLVQVALGAVIGLVGFAKVLTYLFDTFPTQTIYWFIGLILFSIPMFVQKEMKDKKINYFSVLVGIAIIILLQVLNPRTDSPSDTIVFPTITFLYMLKLIVIGAIAGGTMILPGVSGSLVLLILGEYYLFNAYVSRVTDFDWNIYTALFFIGIGVILGIVLSAKLIKYFLNRFPGGTLSFILGLIIASAFILIPFNVNYTTGLSVTSILSLLFGGIIVTYLEKVVR